MVGNNPQKGLLTHDTEVGEGGSSLLGGQKARVQFARALYHQAGVYILDDPLSALDASIGATVFERMMPSLRRKKQLLFLLQMIHLCQKSCDRVFLMGKIKSTMLSNCRFLYYLNEVTYSQNMTLLSNLDANQSDGDANARSKN